MSHTASLFKRLCTDHEALINLGSQFGDFDPLGKLAYLDQMEAIEDRWDIFFARFSLMGTLNQEYVEQCNAFLSSMGLNEQSFRELLKSCHGIMREDAEAERQY
jgi:hypothetical protein